MKRTTLITGALATLMIVTLIGGLILADRAHAQFPPPITGPVIPTDVYTFNAQGQSMTYSTQKDVPYVFSGFMNFQITSTMALTGGGEIVIGVVSGHGRTAIGPGDIAGTFRQELDKANHPTGAILVTFGCGTENFEWLVYFSPNGGSFIDRSLYRRLAGRLER